MIEIPVDVMKQIEAHGEGAYPEEGAGLLLGRAETPHRQVTAVYPIANRREPGARHNRYLISPQDVLRGEQEAGRLGLDVLGVFHSHPDHPDQPSEFDREWALPWYSYLITAVLSGRAAASRSWRLQEDRSGFEEEDMQVV